MTDKETFEKRVGSTLCGKWTLERLLGVGGMAAVYVGVHKIGRRDAIKILHPEVARSKDLRARFEQEAHAVNRFKHPGAVEIRDIDVTDDGAPFLVMELLEGESLAERARRLGGLPEEELLRLVDELLDVLAAAHAEGIIHRDVKLDNLFMQSDGRLKVLDFGIARVRDGAMKTRTGATLGTIAYMPPEQVKGLDIDARADLFAVGATMFRVLAKRRIHDAASEPEMLVKMATSAAPSLRSVCLTASPSSGLIVDRALAFQRERRYPDALTMQTDVRAVRRGEPPPFATARAAAGDDPAALAPHVAGAPPMSTGSPSRGAATLPDPDEPTVVPGSKTVQDPVAPSEAATRSPASFAAPVALVATERAPEVRPQAGTQASPGPRVAGPVEAAPPSSAWPDLGSPPSALVPAPPSSVGGGLVVAIGPPSEASPSRPSSLAHRAAPPRRNDALTLLMIGGVVVLLGIGIGLAYALHKKTPSDSDPPASSSAEVPTPPATAKTGFPPLPSDPAPVQTASPAPPPPVAPPPPPQQQQPKPPPKKPKGHH